MAKTCDIVYVVAHWRGYAKGKAYPVMDYWRGNGSAYKGSHSPIKVAVNYRDDVAHRQKVPFEGGDASACDLTAHIRKTMDNVPTPHIFLSEYANAAIHSKYADSDLDWLDVRNGYVAAFQEGTDIAAVGKTRRGAEGYNGAFAKKLADEGAVLHKTPKGSTVAVSKDGEIGCVKANAGDSYSERTLVGKAISAGGCKATAYEQDHAFYKRAGFVPVAWVHTEEKDYPAGFDSDKNFSCDQIVYLHASLCRPEDAKVGMDSTLDEWKKLVKPNATLKDAENRRDAYMKGEKKIRFESTVEEEKAARRAHRNSEEVRWGRPSMGVITPGCRKKSKKSNLPDTSNWSDWEDTADDWEDEFDIEFA